MQAMRLSAAMRAAQCKQLALRPCGCADATVCCVQIIDVLHPGRPNVPKVRLHRAEYRPLPPVCRRSPCLSRRVISLPRLWLVALRGCLLINGSAL